MKFWFLTMILLTGIFTSKRKDFVQTFFVVENFRTFYDLNTELEP